MVIGFKMSLMIDDSLAWNSSLSLVLITFPTCFPSQHYVKHLCVPGLGYHDHVKSIDQPR